MLALKAQPQEHEICLSFSTTNKKYLGKKHSGPPHIVVCQFPVAEYVYLRWLATDSISFLSMLLCYKAVQSCWSEGCGECSEDCASSVCVGFHGRGVRGKEEGEVRSRVYLQLAKPKVEEVHEESVWSDWCGNGGRLTDLLFTSG